MPVFKDMSWGRSKTRIRDYDDLLHRLNYDKKQEIRSSSLQDASGSDGSLLNSNHGHNWLRLECYGLVVYEDKEYPLVRLVSAIWNDGKVNVLISGGVHGSEPAGVEAILSMIESNALETFKDTCNILIYPCINPSGYELDSRWNYHKQDLNRNFHVNQLSEVSECALFTQSVVSQGVIFDAVYDLHESVLKDAETMKIQAKDLGQTNGHIWDDYADDGFYIYEDPERRSDGSWEGLSFGPHIINAVRESGLMTVCSKTNISGDRSDNGVIYPDGYDATDSDYLKPVSLDSHLRSAGIASYGYTFETVDFGLGDQPYDVGRRASTHVVALRKGLECLISRKMKT